MIFRGIGDEAGVGDADRRQPGDGKIKAGFDHCRIPRNRCAIDAEADAGWPPLEETMQKVVAKKIQIFACSACSRARGVTDADLAQWGAKFGNLTIFVSPVEWADRIITE